LSSVEHESTVQYMFIVQHASIAYIKKQLNVLLNISIFIF